MGVNVVRGQVGFLAAETGWTLSFSVEALIRLEGEMHCTIHDVTKALGGDNLPLRDLRTIFQAGLWDHHPDVTPEDASSLIGALGIKRAVGLIAETFLAAFPPVEEAKGSANPQTAAGTGPASSKRGAKRGSSLTSSGG